MTEKQLEPFGEAGCQGVCVKFGLGLGLYVHVPFCHRKCDYCSFYSIQPQATLPERYLKKLEQDLLGLSPQEKSRIRTIFIGGGNPTALETPEFAHLVELLLRNVDQAPIQEWTFETNPETFDEQKAAILRQIPHLRLSLGLQRLDNAELHILGRAGSLERGLEALALAFSLTARVGVDLILGVPGCADIGNNLELLLQKFPLEHVSAYFLSCEPGTPLFQKVEKSEFLDPGEIGPEELFSVISVLQAHGFEQYEISNFAKPGGECLHNLHYWHGGDYIGLGPAAVGTAWSISPRWGVCPEKAMVPQNTHRRPLQERGGVSFRDVSDGAIVGIRMSNPASLEGWLSGVAPEKEILNDEIRRKEMIMLQLRLIRDGLDLEVLEREFGPISRAMATNMQQHLDAGMLKKTGSRIRLTSQGLIIANRVISSLF